MQRVRHVFGIPGALNAGLYDALARQAEIEHILVRGRRCFWLRLDELIRLGLVEGNFPIFVKLLRR